MSRDDGIYIGWFTCGATSIYAVACVNAIDNLEYYANNGTYSDYVYYVRKLWGSGPFFSTFEKANEFAMHLQKTEKTEYGVKSVGNFKCPLNDDCHLPRMDDWFPDFNAAQTSKVSKKPEKFFALDLLSGEVHIFSSLEKAKVEAKVLATRYERKIVVAQQIYSIEAKSKIEYIEEK